MKHLLTNFSLIWFIISCSSSGSKNVNQNSDSLNSVNLKIIETTKILDKKYSLTFTIRDSLYLFEKHKLNLPVTIIDNKYSNIFESKTTGYFIYEDEMMGQIILTRIFPQPKLKDESNYFAIFSISSKDYKVLEQKDISDKNIINNTDSLIRTSGHLSELLKMNGDGNYVADSILKDVLPKLFNVITSDFEFIVATYIIYNNSTIGPRLAILPNNKVIPLTGQCSFENFYAYYFNGKYYIQTGSGCCDCGVIGDQIFEVVEDDIKLVFEDYSFSN